MNTSTANGFPVLPSYITSFPEYLNPFCSKTPFTSTSFSPTKAEPSILLPRNAAAFPVTDSRNIPTVILDGNACGLIITSGTTPSAVYGRSSWLTSSPTTPFCPCLDANLSPISGILRSLTRILYILPPSCDCVITTVSTTPFSDGLTPIEVSLRYGPFTSNSLYSSINLGGLVFPINISPPCAVDSVAITPSSSNNLYALSPLNPRIFPSAVGISKLSLIPPGYCFASAS